METHEWFEPMAVVLGKGIVRTAAWGLMWRVFIGATLSVTDLATDLLVLKQFWDGGEATVRYRDSSIASLSASIFLQLVIVIVQNRKIGAVRILKEMSVVVLGMKAPYDAYRVAIGSEQEKDALLDPFSEMTCIKVRSCEERSDDLRTRHLRSLSCCAGRFHAVAIFDVAKF